MSSLRILAWDPIARSDQDGGGLTVTVMGQQNGPVHGCARDQEKLRPSGPHWSRGGRYRPVRSRGRIEQEEGDIIKEELTGRGRDE
jgi:hypothetical protein